MRPLALAPIKPAQSIRPTLRDGNRDRAAECSVRLKSERTIFLSRLIAGVRKMDSLLMRYGSQSYVTIEGQASASLLVMLTGR